MAMRKKRILMINLGWEQQPLVQLIASLGHELIGIHSEPPADDIQLSDLLLCDLRDLNSIASFARRVAPDAVISDQCDYSMFAQAVVAEQLGLPGPTVRQAQVATNKLIQREVAKRNGLMIPEFAPATSPGEAMQVARRIGFPVIFKPLDNRGSFGVVKVQEEGQVTPAFFEALVNSHSRVVLIEKFIDGTHITVDGYAFPRSGCRSLSLATKQLLSEDRQVAMDIVYPGEMDAPLRAKAMRVNESVNRLLGFTFGMTHSEYMVTPDEDIYLIESANRGGGCFTSELIVGRHSGVDVLSQLVDDVLGVEADRFAEPEENGVILKFFRFPPGKVASMEGIEDLRSAPGVAASRVNITAGSVIGDITTDGNRHGFVIFEGDRAELRTNAEKVMRLVKVTYE
jgi:biotin carboxylase